MVVSLNTGNSDSILATDKLDIVINKLSETEYSVVRTDRCCNYR